MFWILAGGLILLAGYTWGQRDKISESGSLAKVNREHKARRQQQKQQVMALFESKDEIANDDVEQLLGVSDATATRVLDDLQADGLITAQGEGKGTTYVKK